MKFRTIAQLISIELDFWRLSAGVLRKGKIRNAAITEKKGSKGFTAVNNENNTGKMVST